MQPSTLVALHAHAVLFALWVSASDATWLMVCGCAGHPHTLDAPLVRMAVLFCAAMFAGIVRHLARLAFDAARASRRIAWTQDDTRGLVIAHPASDDWLVQLHIELHPARARRGIAQTCPRAMSSGRVPRGRA
ncbi:hypothetical protein BHUM_02192 [Candidatus Burkholderia humilis]|nr:hypothetical protein BHUM_02192 [Candidatus Burkholderia humilis]